MEKHSFLAFICCFILFILCLCACDQNAQQIVTTEDVVEQTTAKEDKTALGGSVSILKDMEKKSSVASREYAASEVNEIQVETTEIFYEEYIPYEGTVDYYEEVYVEEPTYIEVVDNSDSITWADCVSAAASIGMDEYSLSVMTGWTVREGYIWYDSYLAQLCAYCPMYYWARGENIGWGLSGYGSDGSYTDEGLIWYSYSVSDWELEIIYYALTNPRYDIFGCDGLSYYSDANCIYETWCKGYLIRVWSR